MAKRKKVSFWVKAKAKRTKGRRRGQSKSFGSGLYVKAGKIHRYSPGRDRKIKAKHRRKKKYATWRGDAKGSRI